MAIDFPSSPANNQVYVDTTSGYSFTYITPPGVWKSTGLSVPAVDRQYVWTNTQTFSNVITFSANVLANIVNATSHTAGSDTIANSTGVYTTGVVNAATIQASATFTANATLVNAAAVNITGQTNTATLYAATSANIASATLANATGIYTTGTVNAVSLTTGTNFVANSSGVYHPLLVQARTLIANNSQNPSTPLKFSGLPAVTYVTGSLSLTSASAANTDINLTSYIPYNGVFNYTTIDVKVQGAYVANTNAAQGNSGAAAAQQSHLFKGFRQGIWANSLPSYILEGGTVYATYGGDATNFPAGAINATKVLLIANTTGVYLRLIQRTTPAAQSATYYTYKVEIMNL